jgi:hypothetical protein
MWLAHRAGNIEAMLAVMHRDVEWRPLSWSGRSTYTGHSGVREMVTDAKAASGDYHIDLDDISEPEPDVISAKGHVVASGGATSAVEFKVTMRDGLVYKVETVVWPDDAA